MPLDTERGDMKRLIQIVSTFMKYELSPWVDDASKAYKIAEVLKKARPYKKSRDLALPKEVRLRKTLEELGPVFIKFGQMLSTRADILSKEYVEELAKLQDDTPPIDWKEAKKVLREAWKKDPRYIVKEIEEYPIASASLGQVHKTILKDESRAIVKIQRPGIEKVIDQDIRIMRSLAEILEKNRKEMRYYNLTGLIEEFEIMIHKEIDYVVEGRYAERFLKNFKSDKNIKIPKIFWEYSRDNVLVMEYIDGFKLKELAGRVSREDRADIAKILAANYFKQIFEDLFFHADPHPSNIFLTKEGKVAYLDFGMAKEVEHNFSSKLYDTLIDIARGNMRDLLDDIDIEGFEEKDDNEKTKIIGELETIYAHYYELPKDSNIGDVLQKLLDVFRRHGLKISREYTYLVRSFIIMEGTLKQLDPDMNMNREMENYLYTHNKFLLFAGPSIAEGQKGFFKFLESLRDLPSALAKFSKRLAENTLKIELGHLDELIRELDRVSNRISASIILASVMIGSSLIIHAGTSTRFVDLQIVGTFGFLFAFVAGLWMVLHIMRKAGI